MTKMASVVLKLINGTGRTVTLVRYMPANTAAGNAGYASPDVDEEVELELDVVAAFVKNDREFGRLFTRITSEVPEGQQLALIAGSAVSPEMIDSFDLIRDGTTIWKIQQSDTLQPGAVALVHAMVLGN